MGVDAGCCDGGSLMKRLCGNNKSNLQGFSFQASFRGQKSELQSHTVKDDLLMTLVAGIVI